MGLKISPSSNLPNITKGEEVSFELDTTGELDGNTVASHVFKIYDSSGTDVTTTFGGGSDIADGVITFGIKAQNVGTYSLEFIVTCNETLPDGNPYEFYVEMSFTVT